MTRGKRLKGAVFAAVLVAFLSGGAGLAPAHVTEESGSFAVELGWGEEPPRVGAPNFVEVGVADAAGAAVAVPAEALSVEVVYGDVAVTLPLTPTSTPGTLEAPITPTRPGTYAFDVTGSIRGRALDASATCSDSTFECVEAGTGTEFPVKDPAAGELAQRLSSEADRVEEANDQASGARTLAIIALALAAAALALAVAAWRRRGSG